MNTVKKMHKWKLRMNFYTDVRNTKASKKDESNVFSAMQFLESGNFGAGSGNSAITIRARTDINPSSRPGIFLDCHKTGGAVLYLDTDMKLKLLINDSTTKIITTE